MLLYIKSFARTSDLPSFNFQRTKGQIIEKRGERKRDRKNEGKKGEGRRREGRRGKGIREVCSSSDTGVNTAKAPGFA